MNIPVSDSPILGRRMSVILCLRPDHPESLSAASGAHYADVLTARIPEHRVRSFMLRMASCLPNSKMPPRRSTAPSISRIGLPGMTRCIREPIHSPRAAEFISVNCIFRKVHARVSESIWRWKLQNLFLRPGSIFTRDVFARVRLLLPLTFESVGRKKFSSSNDEKDLFSVAWESVTANLEASLKRLSEDDLQRATTLSSKLGINATMRSSFFVLIFFVLFLFILLKALKLL